MINLALAGQTSQALINKAERSAPEPEWALTMRL